jgi:hypothetical protein
MLVKESVSNEWRMAEILSFRAVTVPESHPIHQEVCVDR